MKNYTVASKITLGICFCFIICAVVNGFTGFINTRISIGATLICIIAVSYTHLTLPTNREVENSVVAVSLKKKNKKENK